MLPYDFSYLSVHQGWKSMSLDIKTDVLNALLKEEIFVSQTQGFVISVNEDHVFHLQQTLYGFDKLHSSGKTVG